MARGKEERTTENNTETDDAGVPHSRFECAVLRILNERSCFPLNTGLYPEQLKASASFVSGCPGIDFEIHWARNGCNMFQLKEPDHEDVNPLNGAISRAFCAFPRGSHPTPGYLVLWLGSVILQR